jgi:hypothetical protein
MKFMRKMFVIIALLIAFFPTYTYATMPVISPDAEHPNADANGDVWYYIAFTDVLDLAVWGVTSNPTYPKRVETVFPTPNDDSQLWKVESDGAGYFRFVNKQYGPLNRQIHPISTDYNPVSFYYVSDVLPDGEGGTLDLAPVFSIENVGDTIKIARKDAKYPMARTGDPLRYDGPIGRGLTEAIHSQIPYTFDFILPEDMQVIQPTLFSTAENPVWHYIQFKNTGDVIQDNGTEKRLTSEVKLDANNVNVDAQLWRIAYDGGVSEASTLPYGAYSIVNKKSGNKIFYEGSSGTQPIDGAGFYSIPGTARYDSLTRICDITISATVKVDNTSNLDGFLLHGNWNSRTNYRNYFMKQTNANSLYVLASTSNGEITDESVIDFVPASSGAGIPSVASGETRIFPNPAKNYVSFEIQGIAKSISVINTTGQTVLKINPATEGKNINVSPLAAGIYFVKIEKSSGTEIVKLIKN